MENLPHPIVRIASALLLHRTRLLCNCLLVCMAALALAPAAHAQRIALVIGNAAYVDKPLRNPVNDATDVAAELRKAGFDVKRHTDLSRRGMIDALRQFTTQAQAAQLAVVYYSGHGMQSAGENYLIPTDARINDEKDVRSEGMALRDILGDLDDAKVQKTVVILDACRDNPYQTRSKGTKKGLARVETAGNATVVAFATADGKTADDGTGRNGVYTTALLGQLRRAPQDIRDLLDETANAVVRQTQDQKPKIYGDTGAFKGVYLAGRGVQLASVSPEPTGRPVQSDPEEETWQAAKAANTPAAYDAYLGEYPRGRYASAARIARGSALGQSTTTQPTPAQQRPANTSSFTAGQVIQDCSDCPQMVVIPAGTFTMGSSGQEQGQANAAGLPKNTTDRESPQHSVNINAFALGKTEVTKGQFAAFVAATGHNAGNNCWTLTGTEWKDTPDRNWRNPGFSQSDNDPVACVSWDDAQAYTHWLAQKTGKGYRLPSEAEWEYACKAGTNSTYCGSDNLDSVAVHGRKGGDKTQPVASKQANAWGLYDMSGNVWEWTQDCGNDDYSGAPSDGSAWTSGNCGQRVLRGGAWINGAMGTRAANRAMKTAANRDTSLGFRLARIAP
jgi:formylglycine-generating enzyme required for sulfatase activity